MTVGQLATGPLPAQVVAADLDGDGIPDLAVRNSGDDTVSLFRGDGAGGFTPTGRFFAGLGTSDLTVADLDGDGRPDLLLASKATGSVLVAPNRGGMVFGEVRTYRAGLGLRGRPIGSSAFDTVTTEATSGLVLGRFGGSGGPDVIAVNPGPSTLGLLTNLGDGRLTNPRSILTRSPILEARVADLNGDGFDDLATLDAQGVSVFLGDGQGGLRLAFTASGGKDPTALNIADVNRDGHADLLVVNAYGDVLTLLGVGDGIFRTDLGDNSRVTLAVADLDGDGRPDFVYANSSRDRVSVEYSAAHRSDVRASGLRSPGQVTLADLNGDGISDLIVANTGGNNVLIYPGIGRGLFGPATNGGLGFATGTGPVGVTVADVDGDGRPDLIVANQGSNDVSILLNRPTSSGFTFTPGPRLKVGQGPVATVFGAFGPVGSLALAVTDGGSNDVRLLPSLGSGFFNDASPLIIPVGQSPSAIVPVTVGGSTALAVINTGSNSLTLISGLGSLETTVQTIGSGGISPVAAVSFHGDGVDGLAVANQEDGTFSLFLADLGGLTLIARSGSSALPSPSTLALGEIGDGQVSFYATNEGQESATLLTFLLAGGSAVSSSTSNGIAIGLQPLQALRESALTLLGTLLSLTLDDRSTTVDADASSRPSQAILPADSEDGTGDESVLEDRVEARPVPDEVTDRDRYLSGVDQALEDLRNEESKVRTRSPGSESEPVSTPSRPDDSADSSRIEGLPGPIGRVRFQGTQANPVEVRSPRTGTSIPGWIAVVVSIHSAGWLVPSRPISDYHRTRSKSDRARP